MKKIYFLVISCCISIILSILPGALSANEAAKLSNQLQEIKDGITNSANEGELNIVFEKTYQANVLHYKKKIKIEQGKTYEILAILDSSEGEIKTELYDTAGNASVEYAGEQFEDNGLKYSGHSIESAIKSQEFIFKAATDAFANGKPIYVAMVEYIDEPAEEPSEKLDSDDASYKRHFSEMGYIANYSPIDFVIYKASDLPIIFEMNVHEGNDYKVISAFSNNRAKPRVIIADPDRGNGDSGSDDYVASFEISTVHEGEKQYYVKIEKASGTLHPDDKVYIYTGYRTSTNTKYLEGAAKNKPENHFSTQ